MPRSTIATVKETRTALTLRERMGLRIGADDADGLIKALAKPLG